MCIGVELHAKQSIGITWTRTLLTIRGRDRTLRKNYIGERETLTNFLCYLVTVTVRSKRFLDGHYEVKI
jgi:hypothetical protein